jgi:hypothetical protein
MSDTDCQYNLDISETDSETELMLVSHHRNATAAADEEFTHQIEQIEKELLNLTRRRRDTQKRVQSLRHAIAILIDIFGPAILDGDIQPFRMPHNLRSRRQDIIDLCTVVLQESLQWLTLSQILELIQNRSPEIVSSLQKPGVSVSNALRTLHRRGRVRRLYNRPEPKWQWVPAAPSESNSETIARH